MQCLVAGAILALASSITAHPVDTTYGPFEILSKAGPLYRTTNDTRYGGYSADEPVAGIDVAGFLIKSDKALYNNAGQICVFAPYLNCYDNNVFPDTNYAIDQDNVISYKDYDYFYACPWDAAGVNNPNNDQRRYIFPVTGKDDFDVDQCDEITLKASRPKRQA